MVPSLVVAFGLSLSSGEGVPDFGPVSDPERFSAERKAARAPRADGVLVPDAHGRHHRVRRLGTSVVAGRAGVEIPNWIGHLHADPTLEPFYPEQWALANTGQTVNGTAGLPGADIGASEAWRTTTGDSSIVVAFLDGGVDIRHPEFAGTLAYNEPERGGSAGVDDDRNGFVDDSLGWDFVRGDGVSRDVGGHGTATASLVASQWNGVGLAGLAPRVRLLPIRVADGGSRVSLKQLVDGIAYAVRRKARVINLSLGGLPDQSLLDQAIAAAVDSGAVVVVSAGNESVNLETSPRYPAASRIPGMVVVGASDVRDRPSTYSNTSDSLVDLSAPGDGLLAAGLPEADTLWSESFESGLSGWTNSSLTYPWGTESLLGSTWLSDSPTGNYPRNRTRSIVSPLLNTQRRQALLLDMSLRGRVPDNDWFLVEVATDTTFAKVSDTVWVSSGWSEAASQRVVLDLGAADGVPCKLRFTLGSDGSSSTSDSGVQLDDLVLRARDRDQPGQGAYVRVWGTSFSAPLVTGALGLMASMAPAAPPESLVQELLRGTKSVATLSGATRTGGRLWVPGALAAFKQPVSTPVQTARTVRVVARRGAFLVHDPGSWDLAWSDLRGRSLGHAQGRGGAAVPFQDVGPVLWTLRSEAGTLHGMVLAR